MQLVEMGLAVEAGRGRRWLRGASRAGVLAVCVGVAGCGNTYRPVVSAISPVGPAGQPTKYAIAVSTTSATAPGLLTFVDVSGDTVVSTPSLPTTVNLTQPLDFALTTGGGTGYIANTGGVLSTFGAGNPPALRTANIGQSTLLAGANPIALSTFLTPGIGTTVFITEAGRTAIAVLNATPSLVQELAVGLNPVYVVGTDEAARAYAISQGAPGGNGQVAAIETTTSEPTISATIPVGLLPVYGVMTADGTRAFILNKGSGTVSVLNVQQNALDSTTPVIPATGTLGANPVWAVVVPTLNELLVVNQGNGTTPGTLSVINIPECNAITQPSNPNCNTANPTDAVGFGTVVATINVGINPTMVAVLSDGSQAYVVNSGNAAASLNGSVSVINLTSNIVTTTLAAAPDASATAAMVNGHPNTIVATTGNPTGKIYVTATDSEFMTIIRTDLDIVDTKIGLQGYGMRVLVTSN